jgi:transposase IS66 family protein
VHAGCWAHARRYFFQALQLNGKDLVAHHLPIRQYLSTVLPGLGEFPANRVTELTPASLSA